MSKIFFSLLLLSFKIYAAPVCPAEDEPKLIVDTGKAKLLVCGWVEEKNKEKIYSEFEIHDEKNGKVNPKAVFKASAVDHYKIVEKDGKLILTELVWMNEGYHTVFDTTVSCDEKSCKKETPVCNFTKEKSTDLAILDEMKALKKTKKVPDDVLIERLTTLAFSGNQEAIKMFEKNPGIKLDGHSSEFYRSTKNFIKKLKKHRCL